MNEDRIEPVPRFHNITLRLARPAEAGAIALMSRDLIENGLGWSWTPERVARNIRCRDTLTVVACATQERLIAFAIMYFGLEEAHLNLLAVQPGYRHAGIGRRLVAWLEQSAVAAGIRTLSLEVRADNHKAQRFYQTAGFRRIALQPGYYHGREAAVRMVRTLRSATARPTL